MLRWTVIALSPTQVFPVELSVSRATIVGRGRGVTLDLGDPSCAERHVALVPKDGALWLEPVRGAPAPALNDVQIQAPVRLSPGDEVALGQSRLVLVGRSGADARRLRLATEDELTARLEEELVRAHGARRVGLLFVLLPPLNAPARQALTRRVVDEAVRLGAVACWAEYTPDVLVALVPEVTSGAFAALAAALEKAAGPRAKLSAACAPDDGADAQGLIERCMSALVSAAEPAEPVWHDPATVRLRAVAEACVARSGAVLVSGPPGAGRATLLRAAAAAVGRPVVAVRLDQPIPSDGCVLLADVPPSAGSALARWIDAAARGPLTVLATSTAALEGFAAHVPMPALAARPLDVLPLAEAFLAQARAQLARPRLVLGPEAVRLLEAYRWPGQVRELKNVIARAARASVRDEVGRDALPLRLTADVPSETLRAALQSTERELLLEALARTRWNVTAAAARLGLPRRTVVYRMAKLGLRRPAR